jgi:RNA ligase (TIGR02306 family)
MSTFTCPVVEIGKIGKHPNADTLSITHVGAFPVVFRTGEYETGDRAVFVPEESLVPVQPAWEFLWKHRTNAGKEIRDKDRVIKALKLRGIFSCGLLMPLPTYKIQLENGSMVTLEEEDFVLGDDMSSTLGITKYEPPEKVSTGGDNDPLPGWLTVYTEIENIRKYPDVLVPGEEVVITEKIHGTNARFAAHDKQIVIGSHHNCKKQNDSNVWGKWFNRERIDMVCATYLDLVFFGEIYGPVQKGYHYGLKEPQFILFDIFELQNRQYMHWDVVKILAEDIGFKHATELYRGPWESIEHAEQFADGQSTLPLAEHNREGCVIKPLVERWDETVGRVALKLIGQEYLLKKYK